MQRLVADTSAILAVAANEPEKTILVELTAGAQLIAPHSVHWEAGNAFSAMLKRGRITLAQARAALAAIEEIPIRFIDVPLAQALDLSSQLGIYAYDAYVIAAALNERCPLLSLDRGLIGSAKAVNANVWEVER